MSFLAFLFVFCLVFILYKRIYFRHLTVLRVSSDGSSDVISVKPSSRWFKSFSLGFRFGLVRLCPNYLALFVDSDTDSVLSFKDYSFHGDILIFRYSFFKLRSVDLSDRVLSDCLSKFNRGV